MTCGATVPPMAERVAMESQFTYQDFDLLIEPDAPGGYRARVLRSPAGETTPVQFTLPFSELELENFVLKVGQPRRTRGPGRPESAPLKDFGGKLYDAVFQDELRETLQRSLSLTRAQRVGMRLRLRLTDTPELARLPWEFLYDRRHNRFLAQSRHTPLVRYLDLPDPPRPLSVEGPLRVLVMISSPSDYGALDVEREWDVLTGALAQQRAEGRVIVERLVANMSTLRARLRHDAFHVFHFVGHGFFRPDWGDGVLVMEDRNGRSHEVTGEELGGLLNEYDPTRLAVLNACEGARSGVGDPFAGTAQSLIQQGLPAVVAMQFEITDAAAIIFARELYAAIADDYPLEAALCEARGAIRDAGNLIEWGTPVLYSRAPDGRLFDLTKQDRVSGVARQTPVKADRPTREEAAIRQRHEQPPRSAPMYGQTAGNLPIYRQIAEDLRRQIQSGELAPGDRLKSEVELMEEYGGPEGVVSRTTIRDAIRLLVARGLVETRPGQGTFVALKMQPFLTRLTLDPTGGSKDEIYRSKIQRQGQEPEETTPRVEVQPASPLVASELAVAEGTSVISRYQERSIDGTPWSLQTIFYPMEFVAGGATDLLEPDDISGGEREGVLKYLEATLGVKQVGWRETIIARPPRGHERAFFGLSEKVDIAIFEFLRTSYGEDGKPIQLMLTVYPADRNQFEMEAGRVPPSGQNNT